MLVSDLNSNEYHAYYKNYIDLAASENLKDGLSNSMISTEAFLKAIPNNKFEYRYAEGKWTIKEIIQHLIDAEIVFAYRALRFSRNDRTELPGFDENVYAEKSLANNRSKEQLIDNYMAVRKASIAIFNSFDKDALLKVGMASNSIMSVRALGFVIIGHEKHHCRIITERYLNEKF
jgi:hypothetical protein